MEKIWDLELSVMDRAESWQQLKDSFVSILNIITNQAERESSFLQVAIISAAYRKATRSAIKLLINTRFKNKISLEDFAWLSFGGEARREVTLKFDQDNGIVFRDDKPVYRDFAEEMVDRLAWMKIAKCEGGVMASNPNWSGDAHAWKKRIYEMISDLCSEEELRRATVLLDIDFVAGNKEFYEQMLLTMQDAFRKTNLFKRRLAKDIMDIPPYLTFFRQLALETRHDRKGLFNFKFACLYPLTGYLRILSWDKGNTVASTRHRIRFLAERGSISQKEADELTRLLENAFYLRLTHQRRQRKAGEELSDFFNLKYFNRDELKLLKQCVSKVEKLKKRLEWTYWT